MDRHYSGGYDPADDQIVKSLRRPAYGPWFLFLLTLGGAGYGAYWGWKERNRLLAAADASEKARGALDARVKALEGERSGLLTAKDVLQKTVDAKSSELAALKGTYDKLQEKMKDEIAKGEIALTQAGGRLRVDMADKILFDSGEAELSKGGQGVLARMGGVLANIGDKEIQVSGHTDNQQISRKLKKKYPTNWELSMTRATNVVRFLQEQAKVPPERLVATGYGEFHPVASNEDPAERARNRRIEILLTPALAPLSVSPEKLAGEPKKTADAPKAAPARDATPP